MDANEFWKTHGRVKIQEFCYRCGTNYVYFKHLAHKRKRPGVDLARKMIADPLGRGQLTLDELLTPTEELHEPDPNYSPSKR